MANYINVFDEVQSTQLARGATTAGSYEQKWKWPCSFSRDAGIRPRATERQAEADANLGRDPYCISPEQGRGIQVRCPTRNFVSSTDKHSMQEQDSYFLSCSKILLGSARYLSARRYESFPTGMVPAEARSSSRPPSLPACSWQD